MDELFLMASGVQFLWGHRVTTARGFYSDNSGVWHDNIRRPIAQDHYATPTDKIVEHALDATSNAPDEWPSETDKAAMDAATFGTGFMLNGKRIDLGDVLIDVPETDDGMVEKGWASHWARDFESKLKKKNVDTWSRGQGGSRLSDDMLCGDSVQSAALSRFTNSETSKF